MYKPGDTEAGRQNKDHEMGIENYAWWRNGEKADICGAPAARLKELSPPAHHRLLLKCRHSLQQSHY